MFNIPIITYHKISNQKELGLTTVSENQFEIQMAYLNSNGYNSVCFKDLSGDFVLPDKPIIITFDDGYENIFHNAAPILQRYGLKSVIFVVTNYIGKYNLWEAVPFQQKFKHLSKDQLIELNDLGHEIASHGKMHRYLPLLREDALNEEIEGSKVQLKTILGEEITSYCYPYGRFNQRITEMVKKSGYKFATSNLRFSNRNNINPYRLCRRSIYATDSLDSFKNKISTQSLFNLSYLSEILIQKGALASIGINFFRGRKSHF